MIFEHSPRICVCICTSEAARLAYIYLGLCARAYILVIHRGQRTCTGLYVHGSYHVPVNQLQHLVQPYPMGPDLLLAAHVSLFLDKIRAWLGVHTLWMSRKFQFHRVHCSSGHGEIGTVSSEGHGTDISVPVPGTPHAKILIRHGNTPPSLSICAWIYHWVGSE